MTQTITRMGALLAMAAVLFALTAQLLLAQQSHKSAEYDGIGYISPPGWYCCDTATGVASY